MKKSIPVRLLGFVMVVATVIIACSPKQQADEIKILMEIRPEVNYVTHLYTLAELGFSDSVYAAKYGHTLPQAAIDTLQKYK